MILAFLSFEIPVFFNMREPQLHPIFRVGPPSRLLSERAKDFAQKTIAIVPKYFT
jgi:hypothetical protein